MIAIFGGMIDERAIRERYETIRCMSWTSGDGVVLRPPKRGLSGAAA